MLPKEEKLAIFDRIEKEIARQGLTRVELARRAATKGRSISERGISNWAAARAAPNLEALIGVCEVLEISADYIIFGKIPATILVSQLENLIATLSEQLGQHIPTNDPTLNEIIDVLLSSSEEDRRLLLEMVRRIHKG